jgi:hypothetical protein
MMASSTEMLLSRIAALRQRLAQTEAPMPSDSTARVETASGSTDPLQRLQYKVAAGAWQTALIDSTTPVPAETPAPVRLTARCARLLQRGRDLLHELRRLAEEPILDKNPGDPLAILYRETVAMIDALLRSVQSVPDAPSAQVRLADGLEIVLGEVGKRIAILRAGLAHRRAEEDKIAGLAELLTNLALGRSLSLHPFTLLANTLVDEARRGVPLHFFRPEFEQAAHYVACHGLVVAQVLARLTHGDEEWNGRQHEPVLAGLLHDVGMLRLPPAILAQSAPLNDAERRLLESHTTLGADILGRMIPSKSWLIDTALCHHERVDGTGYPAGLRQIPSLVRLLTVCDIYAALCSPRPYRAAQETRAALTDTLLLAEQGGLDQFQAERLLDLSFYPVGSVVELSDGTVGVVAATHAAKKALQAPARPILALLADAQGQPLPYPCHLDLTQGDERSIVRTLPPAERQELLGAVYPELV